MATKKKPASSAGKTGVPANINPNAFYKVTMARAKKLGPTWLRPNAGSIRLRGSALAKVSDAVATVELLK